MSMKGFLKTHGSTILTCLGAAGTVATVILAVNETPKALKLLEEAEHEKEAELTTIEKVKVAASVYIPAAVSGVATIACIFGANILSEKHAAALSSAYALVDNSYKTYKNKLKELYGEEADTKIQEEILKDAYKAQPEPIYVSTFGSYCSDLAAECDDKETVLFYDDYSNRYFESTLLDVQSAEYHLNRDFTLRGDSPINEFYKFLGIPAVEGGDYIGWTCMDGYSWIDFSHKKVVMEDGMECYIIYNEFAPEPLYV